MIIIGDRELETGTVAVRTRDGEDLGSMDLSAFHNHLAEEIARRGR